MDDLILAILSSSWQQKYHRLFGSPDYYIQTGTLISLEYYIHDLFGKLIPYDLLFMACGIPSGSKIVLSADQAEHKLEITGIHPLLCDHSVEIYKDRGKPVLNINMLHLNNPGNKLGSFLVFVMVITAYQIGIKQIAAQAIRTEQHNGYYFFPRIGFEGEVSFQNNRFRQHLSHILETPAGRNWWKLYGHSVECYLELNPLNRTFQAFLEYMITAGICRKVTGQELLNIWFQLLFPPRVEFSALLSSD